MGRSWEVKRGKEHFSTRNISSHPSPSDDMDKDGLLFHVQLNNMSTSVSNFFASYPPCRGSSMPRNSLRRGCTSSRWASNHFHVRLGSEIRRRRRVVEFPMPSPPLPAPICFKLSIWSETLPNALSAESLRTHRKVKGQLGLGPGALATASRRHRNQHGSAA